MQTFDIVIVGGGIVGMTLALGLARRTALSIGLIEAHDFATVWSEEMVPHRVSAITLHARALFSDLGIWEDIAASRISPFNKMEVWDVQGGQIEFTSKEIGEQQLGYIVENNLIQTVLYKKLTEYKQITLLAPLELTELKHHDDYLELHAKNTAPIRAQLAIAADGSQSWLRHQVNIKAAKSDYHQLALVTTVNTTLGHNKVARQAFLKTGPLAFLPLKQNTQSSIVWSLPRSQAENLLKLDNETFKNTLSDAFDHRLGEVTHTEQLAAFPLFKQQASAYIKPRIALVGDAAHTVHPLAGQGVNIGLKDVQALLDVLVDAELKQRDIASPAVLRRYERRCKANNFALLTGIDMLNTLFTSEHTLVQKIRSLGLSLTNRSLLLKRFFMSQVS